MPIVKGRGIRIPPHPTFPKNCEIEIERITKTFDKIRQIDAASAMYLLREMLMGYQALAYKFGSFRLEESMCGINEEGECRVWPSKNLL